MAASARTNAWPGKGIVDAPQWTALSLEATNRLLLMCAPDGPIRERMADDEIPMGELDAFLVPAVETLQIGVQRIAWYGFLPFQI